MNLEVYEWEVGLFWGFQSGSGCDLRFFCSNLGWGGGVGVAKRGVTSNAKKGVGWVNDHPKKRENPFNTRAQPTTCLDSTVIPRVNGHPPNTCFEPNFQNLVTFSVLEWDPRTYILFESSNRNLSKNVTFSNCWDSKLWIFSKNCEVFWSKAFSTMINYLLKTAKNPNVSLDKWRDLTKRIF